MADRKALATAFLNVSGWRNAAVSILAGDASNRKYFRVRDVPGKPDAVLMDAPKERGEDVEPFLKMSRFLTESDLSAPRIYAKDTANGFLLIEDLGDDLFSTLCADAPEQEATLYRTAVDVLIAIHKTPPPPLETYAPALMADLGAQAVEWYALGREGRVSSEQHEALRGALQDVLDLFAADFSVTILRDYHAQNLLWLPDRQNAARVGLLDYQDAMIGHPTYDLVSLLEDARRDVSPKTQSAVLDYFIAQTGADPNLPRSAYNAMGAQRNLRILMVFARLSLHFGKPDYVDLIPRTWAHLQHNLTHPDLGTLKRIIDDVLPDPTPAHLSELKEKCGTHPTR